VPERNTAKQRGLRTHLVALVLAVLLPSLALGAATAWHMAGNYRDAFEERLSATAQALALALDREVQAHIAALTALAASPRLDEDDLTGFYAHARGAAEALGTPVAVIGADLQQRLHTERLFGAPLPVTGAPETVRRAVESGRPAVSDLLTGAVLRSPVVAVMVPVVRAGRVDAVLSAPVDPGRLSALLASQGLRGGAFATLTDTANVVVARSHDPAAALGRPVLDWFPKATGGRQAGVLKGRAMVGHDVVLAFRRLASAQGWTVAVAEPLAAYDASWRRPLLALAAGGVATFVVALIAAAWLGRRILRPVRALTRQADAVAASGGVVPVPEGEVAPVAEFESLRLSMRRADMAIRARAAEATAGEARRTLLAREVDHRAKNALAVVQSVLRLTPRDQPGAFDAVEARVAALGRVHSLLAEGGWSGADLRAVAERELAPYAAARRGGGPAPGATVSLDGPPVPLAPAAVQPLAMVLHELATNAAKHGALSAPGGTVEVRWRAGRRAGEDGLLRLRWTETGGPPVLATPARRGFGSRVVEATVRGQLGGTVERRWERTGLVCEVAVPLARMAADAGADAGVQSAAAPEAA
jgi:two-component sensor histidine kinase